MKEDMKMEYIIDDYHMQYAPSRSSEEITDEEIEEFLHYMYGW